MINMLHTAENHGMSICGILAVVTCVNVNACFVNIRLFGTKFTEWECCFLNMMNYMRKMDC